MPSSSGGPEGGGGGALRPSRYGRANTSTGSSGGGSGSGNRGSAGSAAADSPERSALAYLLRYEAMVRTQDLEDGATAEHARPLFGRLLFLGRRAGGGGGGGGNASKGGGQDSGKGDGQFSGNDSMCDSASMTSASVKGSIVGEWTPPPEEDQLPEDGIPDLAAANTQSTDEGGGGGEHAKEEQEKVKGAEGGSAATAAAAAAGLALGADDFDDATVLTYPAMARALRRLEASEGAAEAGRSGGDPAAAASRDFLSADRQLMLLLRTTVDAVEEDERTQPQPQEEEEEEEGGRGLTYPEFLQAYKIVVGGMQTLQRVPRADASSSRAGAVRASIRERTLELLRLFGPGPSRSGSGCSPTAAITASASGAQGSHLPPLAASSSADELDSVSALPSFGGGRRPGGGARGRTPSISSHHGSVSSQSGTGGNGAPQGRRNGSGTGQYGDPTGLPRDSAASLGSALTDADDVRRVLTLKDKTVLNLLSDHAGEMDDLTDRMVEIVSRGRRRRRKIAALAVAMGAAGLALGTALGRGSLLGGPLGSGSGSGARPRTARSEAEAGAGGGSGSGSEAILSELRGARREAGQLRARTKTLERRVADSGAEAARASDDLRGCRTQLAAGAAAAADLRIEGALLAEELAEARAAEAEARAAARAAERATRRRRASASSAPTQAKGGKGRSWREMGLGGDAAEDGAKLARHLSSALWGASGAALAARVALISSGGGFPFAFSGAAVGVVGAVRAAGLGTGIGLGVGAILTGAVPNLLQDE